MEMCKNVSHQARRLTDGLRKKFDGSFHGYVSQVSQRAMYRKSNNIKACKAHFLSQKVVQLMPGVGDQISFSSSFPQRCMKFHSLFSSFHTKTIVSELVRKKLSNVNTLN